MNPTRLLALVVLAACAGNSPKEEPVTPTPPAHQPGAPAATDDRDAELIGAVRAAVVAGVPPARLAAEVGVPPTIDTLDGSYPLEGLRRVDLIIDPDHPDEPLTLTGATGVVYWVRPVTSRDPRVVGIQVAADGTPSVFFAIILPP